jgi:hypothetical protein
MPAAQPVSPEARYGAEHPYSAPPAQQFAAPPAPPAGPYGPPTGPGGYAPPGYGQPPAPPRRKRTGLIIGIVAGVVVLAALAVGAIFLFGTKTLNTAEAEKQIGTITQKQIGTAPTDVQCPEDIAVQSGKTFTCTGTLDGQKVSYTVKETDDKGNVRIDADNKFVLLSKVEDAVATDVGDQAGVDATATCDGGGHTILVDGVGKPIDCTVTNTDDSTDTLDVTATVDADGNVDWTS